MDNCALLAEGPGEPGLVSVVIPTYNRAYIVGRAIESALAQTHRRVEVIVADDGSTDDTLRVASRFHSRVRYVHQPNGGVAAARNLGLRQARGEFIALLDSDDFWLPWKLEAQLAVLAHFPEVGMVWTDMAAVNERREVVQASYLRQFYAAYRHVRTEEIFDLAGNLADVWPDAPPELAGRRFFVGDVFSPMFLGNLVHTSTVVLRRERLRTVGQFDPALKPLGEDYDFHLRTCRVGPVAFIDASSIEYRVAASDQLTAPHLAVHLARHNLRTVEQLVAHDRSRINVPESMIHRRLVEAHAWLGREELRSGNRAAARHHFCQSLRRRPGQPQTAALLLLSLLPRCAYRAVQNVRRLLKRPEHEIGEVNDTGGRTRAPAAPPKDSHDPAPQAAAVTLVE